MDFGFFKGFPHEGCTEDIRSYFKYKNKIQKSDMLAHLKQVEFGLTSAPSFDLITGEEIRAGMCWDGEFTFPYEFIHHYEKYDIGIPPEYEVYLKK